MGYANRYTQAAAGTASRERLMVMLFEKALADIRSGAASMEAGRPIEGRRQLVSALDIVTELHVTLDRSRAPELCDRLGDIYRFVCTRLGDASLKNDAGLAREAERAFAPIAEGFGQAASMIPQVEAR
jgi:flagellar protein FliS